MSGANEGIMARIGTVMTRATSTESAMKKRTPKLDWIQTNTTKYIRDEMDDRSPIRRIFFGTTDQSPRRSDMMLRLWLCRVPRSCSTCMRAPMHTNTARTVAVMFTIRSAVWQSKKDLGRSGLTVGSVVSGYSHGNESGMLRSGISGNEVRTWSRAHEPHGPSLQT